jgi:hypothetical protein
MNKPATDETPAHFTPKTTLTEAVRVYRQTVAEAQEQVVQVAIEHIQAHLGTIVDAIIVRMEDPTAEFNADDLTPFAEMQPGDIEKFWDASLLTLQLFTEVLATVSPEFLAWYYAHTEVTLKEDTSGKKVNLLEYVYQTYIRPELNRRIQINQQVQMASRAAFRVLHSS